MTKEIIICFMFLLFTIYSSRSNGDIWSSTEPTTFETAKTGCERMNMTILLDDPGIQLRGAGKNQGLSLETRWQPVQKMNMKEWTTLSGLPFGTTDIHPESSVENQDCAFIRFKDGLLDETYCNLRDLDYACMYDVRKRCPLQGHCLTIHGNLSVVLIRGDGSWFSALQGCRDLNSTLAEFDKSQQPVFISKIKRKLHGSDSWNVAVGISRIRWVDISTKTPAVVESFLWGPGEPDPAGNCSVSVVEGDDVYWKAVSCQRKFNYSCLRADTTTPGLGPNSCKECQLCLNFSRVDLAVDERPADPSQNVTTILCILLSLLSLYAIVITVLYCRKRMAPHSLDTLRSPSPPGTPGPKLGSYEPVNKADDWDVEVNPNGTNFHKENEEEAESSVISENEEEQEAKPAKEAVVSIEEETTNEESEKSSEEPDYASSPASSNKQTKTEILDAFQNVPYPTTRQVLHRRRDQNKKNQRLDLISNRGGPANFP